MALSPQTWLKAALYMNVSSISEVRNLSAILLCGCVCFSLFILSQWAALKERIERAANEKLL